MPSITEIEQYFKDNSIDIDNLKNISYLLQKNNDLLRGGLRSSNIKSFRTIDTFNSQDSLDATYPMLLHLNISEDMVKIVSIRLSFWLLPFRAYSTAAASGGGSTSGSGGGTTKTSTSVAHNHSVNTSSDGSHTHAIGPKAATTGETEGHTHSYSHADTHSDADGTHNHSITISSGGAHTHQVTLDDHTHTTPNHTHDISFGIHEEDNSPTIGIQISRDNGKTYGAILGTYTADVANLEIKDYIETSGSYIIRFTSTARARLSAQLTAKLDITAR